MPTKTTVSGCVVFTLFVAALVGLVGRLLYMGYQEDGVSVLVSFAISVVILVGWLVYKVIEAERQGLEARKRWEAQYKDHPDYKDDA